MKVLFVGDSPTVSTGFSRCTRTACDALISRGYEVVVLGMAYYGDPHDYPYEIWPCYAPLDQAKSYGGEARLASMIARVKPDVVVILQDPWNLPQYFECLDAVAEKCKEQNIEFNIPPVVGWLAVDSKNQKAEQLERLAHIMVWTEFAREEFLSATRIEIEQVEKRYKQPGLADDQVYQLEAMAALNRVYHGAIDIVPLGVDTSLFYPRDKNESRTVLGFDQLGIPQDAFIVGVVGRNQTRKRLELTLDYFAEWIHRENITDAYLYLHVAPTGENSCDLKSLVSFFGLRGRVIVHTPDAGTGDDDSRMPFVYSAMDVYMTQSQGEGFGLPALEAMACGIECMLPDHSAFSSCGGWVEENCAYRVPCSGVALTAPLNQRPYTVGAIANREETVKTLSYIYQNCVIESLPNQKALDLAQRLTWQNTGELFVDSLESFFFGYNSQKAYNSHKWIGSQIGGSPADAVSTEWIRFCDVCGCEDCGDPSEFPDLFYPVCAEVTKPDSVDVCITVLNRYDLLRKCLESLSTVKNRGAVYVIDNGMNHAAMTECVADLPFNVSILNTHRLGLAESWNLFISHTKGARIITNDDIEFSSESINMLSQCSADLVFPQGIGYSCFLLRDSCIEKVGLFDENLSPGFAYFEDCDYTKRIEQHCANNSDSPASMQDVKDHGIIHHKNGTQQFITTNADRIEYKRRYYIAQENFISKWSALPPGLRRMEKSECEAAQNG